MFNGFSNFVSVILPFVWLLMPDQNGSTIFIREYFVTGALWADYSLKFYRSLRFSVASVRISNVHFTMDSHKSGPAFCSISFIHVIIVESCNSTGGRVCSSSNSNSSTGQSDTQLFTVIVALLPLCSASFFVHHSHSCLLH